MIKHHNIGKLNYIEVKKMMIKLETTKESATQPDDDSKLS